MPRVSVALPCYNGELHLAATLANLMEQTATDFNVIIYDNGSTDQTNAIAHDFAARDKRCSVVRRPVTIDAYENFRLSLAETDCDYFMWRADDDLTVPNYLEVLIRTLDENPAATTAGSHIFTHKVGPNITISRPFPKRLADPLADRLNMIRNCHTSWIYGLHRRDAFQPAFDASLGVLSQNWGSDYLLLFQLIMRGQVVGSNVTQFTQRTMADPRKAGKVHVPSAEQWAIFSAFRQICYAEIDASSFSAAEKLRLKAAALKYSLRHTFRFRKMLVTKLKGR